MFMRSLALACCGVLACHGTTARAQSGRSTSFDASLYFYAVPDDDNYLQPTVRADADRLHIEARYNYEGKRTISLWGGYVFARGETVSLAFTPMLGLVAGDYSGFAPGVELALGWKLFELYTEGEYVHDFNDSANSFFYSWSELSASLPLKWRVGAAMQRTQTYESARETQRGLLLGASFEPWGATFYVFGLDDPDPIYVLSAYVEF